jgi:Xaa-Pro aminopeptidase
MNPLTGIKALLIANPTNIRYLTGFVGAAPDEHEVYLLLTPNKRFLYTNSLYLERANMIATAHSDIDVVRISRDEPITRAIGQVLKLLKIKRLGFESKELTFAEYIDFARHLKGVKLIPTTDRIENLRMIKTPTELTSIRQAARITDDTFAYIKTKIKPGVTETRLADLIEAFFRRKNARSAFAPIVAFGANTSQPHYIPSAKCKLKSGEMILFDIGARVNGYCADMTRVVFTKPPSPEIAKAYQTVLMAQSKAIDAICRKSQTQAFRKHGLAGSAIDILAKSVIRKAGFPPYSHSLGHNVGLAIHEKPRLTVKSRDRIKNGMVFSIEPGIYVPGKFGIRIEDLVYLDENGLEILSLSPKGLDILSIK